LRITDTEIDREVIYSEVADEMMQHLLSGWRLFSSDRRGWLRSAFFRHFVTDRSGAVAVVFALSLPILIGFTGLAIDTGVWFQNRSKIQLAADAAAIAGAHELAAGQAAGSISTAAQTAATQNGMPPATATVSATASGAQVAVTAQMPAPLYFSQLFMPNPVTISATATASFTTEPFCILALDRTASGVITDKGNGALIANGCGVQANSSSSTALSTNGNGTLQAQSICVTGGYSGGNYSPTPKTHCPPLPDPLAALAPPPVGTCQTFHNTPPILPGTYCGGISLAGQANVTLQPGLYVLKDGGLSMSGSTSLQGTGVTFYLTGNSPTISIAGGTTVKLSAPVDNSAGGIPGILFFMDRSEPVGTSAKFAGGSTQSYEGTIYMPSAAVSLAGSGSGTSSTTPFSAIIADTVSLVGNGNFVVNSNYASSSVPLPPNLTVATVALVQ
jgi:Flp pilus assembly protein TadG